MQVTCTYGLTSKVGMVECGKAAVFHVKGQGLLPRGLDQMGAHMVPVDGNYCAQHARTVKNRLTDQTTTPLETP